MTDKTEMRDSIKVAVVKNLKNRMTENSLTPTMLSEFANLCHTCVSCMVGTKYAPNTLTLCLLCKVLRCTLNDLIPPSVYQ